MEETDGPPLPQDDARRSSVNKARNGRQPANLANKKKAKRGVRGLKKGATSQTGEALAEHGQGSSPEAVKKPVGNSDYKGKGWRQTPILQDNSISAARTPGIIAGAVGRQAASSVKHGNRQNKAKELEAERNGWATEDATDIQELPEFDFESNLSKFDKRTVFDQLRHDDVTAEGDRLVSFNRVPASRPGTYGGKNLHPTENVLDSPQVRGRRPSFVSSNSDISFDLDGRASSHRNISRSSTMRMQMRSTSSIHDDNSSIAQPRGPRPQPRNTYGGSASHLPSGSPNPSKFTPPESPSFVQQQSTGYLQIAGSDRRCPTITPGGMAAIEEVAETEFGLPVELMNESAGRGIADVVMQALNPTGRRMMRDNVRLNSRPVALLLVGNHRAGARALAAARHLRGRSIRVVACLLGFERQNLEMEKDVRKQADVLSKLGAAVRGWSDVRNYLVNVDGAGQPEVIVDALLTSTKSYDSLSLEDQRAVTEMVGWVNRSTGRIVVSVDVPSGINGSTGESDISFLVQSPGLSKPTHDLHHQLLLHHHHRVDQAAAHVGDSPLLDSGSGSSESAFATPLEVRAKHVVCIGAPRTGLLRALHRTAALASQSTSTGLEAKNWQLWVVDIGVNKAWRNYGVSGGLEGGVKFGGEWVVQVGYVDGES